MPPFYYLNTVGSKVSTSTTISFCQRKGPISACMACSVSDQHGCKYRRDASHRDCCMYFREDLDGACDNSFAQLGIEMPKFEEEKKEEPTTTIIPT